MSREIPGRKEDMATKTLSAEDLIVAILIDNDWTITQHGVTGALRAERHNGGDVISVYFGGAHNQKVYGCEAVIGGQITRLGNIPWLTETIVATIKGEDSVTVEAQFAITVDGEPMGEFQTPNQLTKAVVEAYAMGAVKVEIVRAK